jgi:hypothetical protein
MGIDCQVGRESTRFVPNRREGLPLRTNTNPFCAFCVLCGSQGSGQRGLSLHRFGETDERSLEPVAPDALCLCHGVASLAPTRRASIAHAMGGARGEGHGGGPGDGGRGVCGLCLPRRQGIASPRLRVGRASRRRDGRFFGRRDRGGRAGLRSAHVQRVGGAMRVGTGPMREHRELRDMPFGAHVRGRGPEPMRDDGVLAQDLPAIERLVRVRVGRLQRGAELRVVRRGRDVRRWGSAQPVRVQAPDLHLSWR